MLLLQLIIMGITPSSLLYATPFIRKNPAKQYFLSWIIFVKNRAKQTEKRFKYRLTFCANRNRIYNTNLLHFINTKYYTPQRMTTQPAIKITVGYCKQDSHC